MKKSGLILAILLPASAAALPWLTGVVAERNTAALFTALNERSFEYGTTQTLDYQRGYRTTTALYRWEPPAIYREQLGALDYRCEGTHDFGVLNYVCRIDAGANYTQFLQTYLGGRDPFALNGSVSVLGTISQTLSMDAFTVNDGGAMAVGAGHLTLETDNSLSAFTLQGELAGLSVTSATDTLNLGPLTLSGDFAFNDLRLMLGTLQAGLASVDASGSSGQAALRDMTLNMAVAARAENIDIDYRLGLRQLIQTNTGAAPQQFDDIAFDLSLQGIDQQKYAAISEKLSQFSRVAMESGGSEADLAPAQMQLLSSIVPDAEALLKPGLTFKTHLSAAVAQQPMHLNLDLGLTQRMTSAELMAIMFNPPAFLEKMQAHIDLQIPPVMLAQEPQLATRLQAHPLFESTTDGIKTAIVLEKDNVSLNGNAMTIDELLALGLQQ